METTRVTRTLVACMLSLSLSACGGLPSPDDSEASPAGHARKPVLSVAAEQALARAEADVMTAREAYTLWTTADAALHRARAAAARGDSETVISEAKTASGLCDLGRKQATYPATDAP